MKFTKDNYYQEKLTKLILTNESIEDMEFEECEFKDCSFIECRITRSKFINCKFESCVLSAVVPLESRFTDVEFINSKVIGMDWTRAQHINEISFASCQLNYSSFRLLKLPKIKMTDCEAKEVDFTETDLNEGVFTGTDFEKSIFSKTNLTKADLRGAKHYYIDARNNTIKKAKFSLPEAMSLLNSLDVVIE